ncbi:50S ribosomal protein L11 methyltransferase [Fodinicurvata sediminis]|uniref:50S ribosomal protein L11 methyltransferase n=1 Tax=Fodinicurvata sediminis TaxID=1121832 RepID=UPI0003B414D6|nr:50S ribosomal protein L11 methyltransferase [Fodinicurvata sediminis]
MNQPIYCLTFAVPSQTVPVFEDALEGLGAAIAVGGPDRKGDTPLQVYLGEDHGETELFGRLVAAALGCEIDVPDYRYELMPETDWVAESQAALPPLQAGRFFVHGSHVQERPAAGAIPLLVEANIAFGTGRHETTRGCLLALCDLAKRGRKTRVLDLGCGSGILAMGAAHLWPKARILATDNDPGSVRVARENAGLNRLSSRVRSYFSQGYAHPAIKREGPYDLIVANILAAPLCRMATDTARHAKPGGHVILSGLLWHQERWVRQRHRAAGLVLEARYKLGDWTTLLLRAR